MQQQFTQYYRMSDELETEKLNYCMAIGDLPILSMDDS